jgi:hypothetical protein
MIIRDFDWFRDLPKVTREQSQKVADVTTGPFLG